MRSACAEEISAAGCQDPVGSWVYLDLSRDGPLRGDVVWKYEKYSYMISAQKSRDVMFMASISGYLVECQFLTFESRFPEREKNRAVSRY